LGRGRVKRVDVTCDFEVDLSDPSVFNDRPFGSTKPTPENAQILRFHTASAVSRQGAMTDLSEIKKLANYRPTHKVRFVTAASLFDGHDASINIRRRKRVVAKKRVR
jgi:hypothetical protein